MERIKQNKWLMIILSVAMFITATLGIVFMSQQTSIVKAEANTYNYSYNGSTWSGTPEASYKAGDTITIKGTGNVINGKIVGFTINGVEGKTTKRAGSAEYTVATDGATLTLINDGTVGRAVITDGYKLVYDGNSTDTTYVAETSYYASEEVTIDIESALESEIVIIKSNPVSIEGAVREGYSFLYWNTKEDGSGTTYYTGDELTLTKNMTLYAFWEKVESGNYLTFTANGGDVEIDFTYYSGKNVCYSLNNGTTWTPMTAQASNIIELNENQSVCFKGIYLAMNEIDSNEYCVSMTAKTDGATVEASGDITSLTNSMGGDIALAPSGCYRYMFKDCYILTKAPNLPSTTLASYCYQYMFDNCTGLKTASTLPATSLKENCYDAMFFGCSSLEEAPVLNATTLAYGCYNSMFSSCVSLTEAPKLPATILADICYYCMFSGCINLKKTPALPATKLTKECYSYMFSDCTNLKVPADI